MLILHVLVACGSPETVDSAEPRPGTDAPCPRTPCVTDVASATWMLPSTLDAAVGDDLAVHGDTVFAGAPMSEGEGPGTTSIHALTLPELSPIGHWKGESRWDSVGGSVAAGDPDRDGVVDLLAGAAHAMPSPEKVGGVYLLRGVPQEERSITDASLATFFTDEWIRGGTSVAFAALGPEGTTEVIVSGGGMLPDWGGGIFALDLAAWRAGEATAARTITGPPGFGQSFAAWDGDADGVDDLVVSTSYGAGWLRGPWSAPLLDESDLEGGWTARDLLADGFGANMSVVGDITGDGASDLVIASWMYSGDVERAGRAYVIPGGRLEGGVADELPIQVRGTEVGEGVGRDLAGADIDGDGTNDLVVGASGMWPGTHPGAVLVFSGPVEGVSEPKDAAARVYGEFDGDYFGRSIAVAEVDGDDRADLVVGALGWPAGWRQGAVYVVPGAALWP